MADEQMRHTLSWLYRAKRLLMEGCGEAMSPCWRSETSSGAPKAVTVRGDRARTSRSKAFVLPGSANASLTEGWPPALRGPEMEVNRNKGAPKHGPTRSDPLPDDPAPNFLPASVSWRSSVMRAAVGARDSGRPKARLGSMVPTGLQDIQGAVAMVL